MNTTCSFDQSRNAGIVEGLACASVIFLFAIMGAIFLAKFRRPKKWIIVENDSIYSGPFKISTHVDVEMPNRFSIHIKCIKCNCCRCDVYRSVVPSRYVHAVERCNLLRNNNVNWRSMNSVPKKNGFWQITKIPIVFRCHCRQNKILLGLSE